jgi:hypothetical protein
MVVFTYRFDLIRYDAIILDDVIMFRDFSRLRRTFLFWETFSIERCYLRLTVSLVSQFFSREFCGKWDSLLAKISVRVSRVSQVSREGENAIYCQASESRNLRDSQTSKIKIHSEKLVLDSKFSKDSELNLIMILASLATKFLFARLASPATKFVGETREKLVLLRNFSLWDS